jgi:hypothetical protein
MEASWKDKAKLREDLELDQGAIQFLFYAGEDGFGAGRARDDMGRAGTTPSGGFPSDKVESEIQAPVVLQLHEEAAVLPATAAIGSDVLVGKTRPGLMSQFWLPDVSVWFQVSYFNCHSRLDYRYTNLILWNGVVVKEMEIDGWTNMALNKFRYIIQIGKHEL